MKKLFIMLLFFTVTLHSQTVSYTEFVDPATNPIKNPERGFYIEANTRPTTIPASATPDYKTLNTLFNIELYQIPPNVSLIRRIIRLDDFRNLDTISKAYINNIKSDFTVLKNKGLKCILIFSYFGNNTIINPTIYEPTETRILLHINQLRLAFESYDDVSVVSSIEAGFIGKYGEWAYSTNFGNSSSLSSANLNSRKKIGNAIMTIFPNRMVGFRTPRYQRLMLGLLNLAPEIPNQEPTNPAFSSRIAAQNDCFLSSNNDMDTYGVGLNDAGTAPQTMPSDKAFLENQSRFTFNGGETCNFTIAYAKKSYAIPELRRFHFNYLNATYFPGVMNAVPPTTSVPTPLGFWADPNQVANEGGFLDEVRRNLGYRFVLTNSTISGSTVSINLRNFGFANVFNPRKAYLVLKNTAGNIVTKVDLTGTNGADVRTWNAANIATPNTPPNVNLSKNLAGYVCPGTYSLFLELPDFNRAPNDTSPKYSIRLANTCNSNGLNVWEATTGLNNLYRTITITTPPTIPTITGSLAACTTDTDITKKRTTNSTTLLPGQTAVWTIGGGGVGTFVPGTNTTSTAIIDWATLPAILTLTVTSPGGCTVTNSRRIENVCNCDCVNGVSYGNPVNIIANTSTVVSITPMASSGSEFCDTIITYNIYWGDGSSCNNCLSHQYTASGTYMITVVATSDFVCTHTNTFTVTASGSSGSNGKYSNNTTLYNDIKISPNPTKGILTIGIEDFKGKVNIEVVDINGRVIYESKEVLFENEKTIDLSSYQSGIYIIKVNGENINFSEKLIRN